MATLHEILDNLGGALRIAGNLILQPITRSHYRFWGATKEDKQRTLPGDERVPDPMVLTTLAITINAPASEVWPWVAQLGQERGGMYRLRTAGEHRALPDAQRRSHRARNGK